MSAVVVNATYPLGMKNKRVYGTVASGKIKITWRQTMSANDIERNELYRDKTRSEVVRVRGMTDSVVEVDRYGGDVVYITTHEFTRDYEPMYRRYGRYV